MVKSSTTAANWFTDELRFRQLCGDAHSQAQTESGQEFAADMIQKAKQYGLRAYLSPKQLAYLCKLADWELTAAQLEHARAQ